MICQQVLISVRLQYGNNMEIPVSSGYRCPRKNTAEGSKSTSKHVVGKAFDWPGNGLTTVDMWNIAQVAASQSSKSRTLLYFGSGNYKSLATLENEGCDGTHLPAGWSSYTNGHVDR